jgi:hypothetical protein
MAASPATAQQLADTIDPGGCGQFTAALDVKCGG